MTTSALRERYSVVASTLALVLSLGVGGAYASGKIGADDIARNAVTSKAIKNGTVTGQDLKDHSVGANDLARNAVPKPPAGPTAFVSDGSTPTTAPGLCCFSTATVTLAKPSRVLVVLTIEDLVLVCDGTGGCSLDMGAYVTSGTAPPEPVPNAGSLAQLGVSQSHSYGRTVSGVVDLPAGTHTIGLGFTVGGNWQTYGGGAGQTVAVVLGNASGATSARARPRADRSHVPLIRR